MRPSDAARRTMDESLAAARGVGRLIGAIGAGASEQLLGITQVNEAVANAVGVFRLEATGTPIDAVALRRAARERRAPALRSA